ncbi:substrate-binding periplasmic protein [Dongshaea marina]|uniref:substrate-binding periplasmic protein n=1 Tax=Dongshaea marina TaxID=2047966 RepID=UPI00131F45DB|nr:transporter substrate-binding domain-containing protein [Dongshaea marina]
MVRTLLSFLLLWPLISVAASSPQRLNLCHEDQNAFPWVFTAGSQSYGLDIELLRLVADRMDIEIRFHNQPWRRCLQSMQFGQVDGVFASSFKQNRLQMGHYPMTPDGQLDKGLRIHISGYSLYRQKGSRLTWSGNNFSGLTGRIGVQPGFSIVDRLRMLNVKLDEGARGPVAILDKLRRGRIQGAALQTLRADFVISQSALLRESIEKWPEPISEKPYYLMLSFDLVRKHPDFSQRLWNTLAEQRESKHFEVIKQQFWREYAE